VTDAAASSNIVNSTLRKNRSSIRLGNGRRNAPIDALTVRRKPYSDKAHPKACIDSRFVIELSLLQRCGLDFTVDPYSSDPKR
jgi:hypothetical protein